MTVSKPIRIGIIGTGGIAHAHMRAYKQIPGVEVVGGADIIPGKARKFFDSFDLPQAKDFADHRQLLELDLDGVSICTPNNAHHENTVNALLAGKHVLTEKPMSVTLEDAVDMARTAKKTGKLLTVGFQPRYDPNMKLLQQIVQSGQLGKVYYIQTGGGRRRGIPGGTFIRKESAGAGALADIGCYSLDMALNTIGYPKPLTVSAYSSSRFGKNPKYFGEAANFEVEDFGVAMIRLEGDICLNFKISWAMHMDSLGPTVFLGEDAGLKVLPFGSGPWSGVWDGKIGSITMFHDIMGLNTESPIPLINHNVDLFHKKVSEFVEAIREDQPAPIPGDQIVINQAIIDGILRSAETKREVDIVIPEL